MKKIISVMSLTLGLLASVGFVSCGGESDSEDSFIPVDGEQVYMSDYQATFTFINGAKEVELTKATDQMGSIPEYVDYKGKQFRVTRIGDRSCQHLQYAFSEIPEGVVSIGEEAFEYHKATSIKLPSTLKTIGAGAFSYNNNLENIAIPNGVTVIEPNTFLYDKVLSTVTIPSSVIEIKEAAFVNCGFTSLTIPGNVLSIGVRAYANCAQLKTLVLEDGVKNIGEEAFSQCEKLESVVIPQSVTAIESEAFFCGRHGTSAGEPFVEDTGALTSVTSKIREPFPISEFVFGSLLQNGGTLYVPKGTAEKYKTTEGWKEIKNIVEQ